jgi:VanZ family protein
MSNRGLSFWRIFSAWMPAILGIAVIMCESTDSFSSANTSHPLRTAWEFLFGPVTNAAWDTIHHHIRKSGHFTGYGLLSALFFRAWYMTLGSLKRMAAPPWLLSVLLALACTLLTGSSDEFHQKFIPSRGSSPVDVAIDMAGAIAVQLLITAFFLIRASTRSPVRISANS